MHFPRKRFGQHFLHDQAVIEKIIAALSPQADQHLVEIGPGQGALTVPVLARVSTLEAIELDHDLIAPLKARTSRFGRLQVFCADALSFDFSALKQDARLLRIFGNLPYNISTPLLFHLFSFMPVIYDMLFMLQKEVAERLTATSSKKTYGRLTVMAQYHCYIEKLFDISKDAFYPPPKVQSSIVHLLPRRTLSVVAKDYILFAKLVKQAFNQRRKTIRNSLQDMVPNALWTKTTIPANARAENLSVNDFVELSNLLIAET